MEKHPIGELMEATMGKIREMVDVNTIVGQPITTPEGITMIPVSRVSFGFASGGSDFQTKQQSGGDNSFGGGSGAGVKITPVAFVVIKNGDIRLLYIAPPAESAVERVIDNAPDIVDKIGALIDRYKKPAKNAPAQETENTAE